MRKPHGYIFSVAILLIELSVEVMMFFQQNLRENYHTVYISMKQITIGADYKSAVECLI